MSTPENQITKKRKENEAKNPEVELEKEYSVKIPKDERISVDFLYQTNGKLALKVEIEQAKRKSSWQATQSNMSDKIDAIYSYLRSVLPKARRACEKFSKNSNAQSEADEILKEMIAIMGARNLPIVEG